MSHLLHRQIHHAYPVATGGEGVHLIDAAGKRYIDASGGAAVSCLGHQHPRVLAAMHAQLDRLAYAHTSFFTSSAAEELGEELMALAPAGMSHVYLVSGGSEAVEAALKMARQYFVERGESGRRHFISRRQSYHGNTLGALAVGGNAWRRQQFAPILVDSHYIDPCYEYRYRDGAETPAAYGLRAAAGLEAKILELGAENVIAFVAETVVGATLGAVPPAPGYLRAVREICDRHGILLILDEVMCGMGRTGTLHACEQDGVSPDLMTVAKGLGGGYAPIGATFVGKHIYEAFAQGSGMFQHGHTYVGHPLACAAALAAQRVIRDEHLLENVAARGAQLERALRARFGDHPHVGDIRGRGLFWGVELVAERSTKTPFEAGQRLHARLKASAMQRGLMAYPMGGTIDGRSGDHVLLAPPFICDAGVIDDIVDRLGEALDAAIAELPATART
ncbi:aspartate aminotransferase family protein [Janthinobacterium sp.]|uniref:aspartate aminotransferase family protein n=1 Tax=Janthinobacterium sp. TaxID=1871054 RepID=UPI00293D2AC6|nr:aspartate aminotransferase family protein [Janthinobacterium sp.]